ncbi:GNAT family N-acetyltransferase [Zooshikella sp. WH53]|uniref:GNAT family N-acetyltransferase n=1 Tax=Zooshikella harenae TaxID=2827238 RepID=A0ABS5ZKE8_9GAMM|nr:GNAT family N-acetyltransferase [Zooshikella harenae]
MLYKGVYWLDWGMINRNRHGRGIGSTLLEYRIKKIHEESSNPKIKLCTSQHTVGFYEKFGFKTLSKMVTG